MERTSNRWNKRICALAAILAFLLFPVTAHAFSYQGDGILLEIPDGSNIYYYTPNGTNMTGEMLMAAQEENPMALTGAYNKGKNY